MVRIYLKNVFKIKKNSILEYLEIYYYYINNFDFCVNKAIVLNEILTQK